MSKTAWIFLCFVRTTKKETMAYAWVLLSIGHTTGNSKINILL